MTTVTVLADPPRPGLVLPDLPASAPVSEAEAADLYAAMLKDVLVAADAAGGDLLVNYRSDDALDVAGETSAEAAVRALAADALGDLEDVRFEVQVGSTFAARVGNTVTHLLDEEGVTSVGVARPTAPLLVRTDVDSASMKLRSAPVVLGPAPGGRVHYAAFTDPVDFAGAFDPPALSTLTARARDAGHDVDFVEMHPVVETGDDLATVLAVLDARGRAGRARPEHLAAAVDDLGLGLAVEDGMPEVVRS
jgi:glycosyltransferase A (GT-A) superfamily protein (DUF2064 family)